MRKYLQNTSQNDHIRPVFKLQNTSNTRFGMSPKLSSQGMSNNFQQQFCENARASFRCQLRAPLMEWFTDVADVKLQMDGQSFANE